MIATGWSNGNPNNITGSGYGIRIRKTDRDKYYKKDWTDIVIVFDNGNTVNVPLSTSFWNNWTELRSKEIGKWMIPNKFSSWEKGNPPKFHLEYLQERRFHSKLMNI